jgi:hypothetical protein
MLALFANLNAIIWEIHSILWLFKVYLIGRGIKNLQIKMAMVNRQ